MTIVLYAVFGKVRAVSFADIFYMRSRAFLEACAFSDAYTFPVHPDTSAYSK